MLHCLKLLVNHGKRLAFSGYLSFFLTQVTAEKVQEDDDCYCLQIVGISFGGPWWVEAPAISEAKLNVYKNGH